MTTLDIPTEIQPTPVPADENWDANDEKIAVQLRGEMTDDELAAGLASLERADILIQAARAELLAFNEHSDVAALDDYLEEIVGGRRYYTEAAQR